MRSPLASRRRVDEPGAVAADARWNWLYRIGGAAAVFAAAVIPIQLLVFVAWGQPETAPGWFTLFQENRLAGLLAAVLNWGLYVPEMGVFLSVLSVVSFLAAWNILVARRLLQLGRAS